MKAASITPHAGVVIENLRKRFGDTVAVDGLSFTVEEGALFGLIGPDGAGKTTTLRMLCGLVLPDAGTCRIAGLDPFKEPRAVRRLLGYMPERFSLYPDLTVAENLRFFADLFGVDRAERQRLSERLLEFSRLSPFRNRKAAHLSGGMKQKLALACTLVHTPRVLLLDEPTTGVDPVSRGEFWEILYELKKGGTTLLLTTPYMDEAARCDRIGFVRNGRLLLEESPAEIPLLLKHQLLEVVCDRPFAAARALANDGRFVRVQLFGDRIHVSADCRPPLFEEQVKACLAAAGIALHSLKPIKPSIEDVFVELVS